MSHRHLKEELTCPICMELFRQPRRLPCGHSYCYTCLKAMLERCLDNTGLYLHYTRSLVCPECREEVNLDYGSGVDVIPPDFKLSKLVDLFKFMKKNDSSDSSGDELHFCHPVPCVLTSTPFGDSVAAPITAFVSATNLPVALLSQHTNLPSSPVSRPLPATSVDSQPTHAQTVTTLIASSSTSTITSTVSSPTQLQTAITVTSLSTQPQIATTSNANQSQIVTPAINLPHITTSVANTHPQISTSASNPPTHSHISYTSVTDTHTDRLTNLQVQSSSGQLLSAESSAVVIVDSASTVTGHLPLVDHDDQSTTTITRPGDVVDHFHQDDPRNISVTNKSCLTPARRSSSSLLPPQTTSNRSSSEQTNYQSQSSSAERRLLPDLTVPVYAAISSDNYTDNDVSGTDRNNNEDLNSYPPLGAVGGSAANGRNRNSLPSRTEQNVDSSEILSNWVNENHFYSQTCPDLSRFSSPLPKDFEAQSCHGSSPSVLSLIGDRATRAQSVPAETRELKRSEEDGRSPELQAVKSHRNTKARRIRNGVFSLFVESDSSSDSSGSDRRVSRRSAGKPKRWLMTRFLRSVILSDSSSTDYSDDDDDGALGNKATHSQKAGEKTDVHSSSASSPRPHILTADQTHSPQLGTRLAASTQKPCRIENPAIESHHGTNSHSDHVTLNGPRRQQFSSSSTREHTGSEVPGQLLHSADSTTSPKELSNQTASARSIDSTIPKVIHRCQSATEITNDVRPISTIASVNPNVHTPIPQTRNPHFTRRQCRQTTGVKMYQPTSNTPIVGSPPTFYDNVNVIASDNKVKTWYDNYLPNVGSPPTFYDNVRIGDHTEHARSDNAGYREDEPEGSGSIFVGDPSLFPNNDSRFEACNPQQSSGPYDARTLYDNLNSSHTRPMQTSSNLLHNHSRTKNPITDIEELKTGYEHVQLENEGDNNCDEDSSDKVSDRTDRYMGELSDNNRWLPLSSEDSQYRNEQRFQTSSYIKSSDPVSARVNHSPANHTVVDSNSGQTSLYDNISNSVYEDHPQYSTPALSNQVNAGDRRKISEGISPNKTESSAQRQRILNSDFTAEGHHNTQPLADTSGRSSEDSQLIENYFDHYSQHFRGGCASDQNSATPRIVTKEDNVCQRTGGTTEEVGSKVSSLDGICSKTTRDVQNSRVNIKDDVLQRRAESTGSKTEELTTSEAGSCSTSTRDAVTNASAANSSVEGLSNVGNPEAASCSTSTRDAVTNASATSSSVEGLSNFGNPEAGSLSGTSMKSNKKKPQSRLRKFFTSLLSLSSSDDGDDENYCKSSSDSSDW